ncbi:GlpM family protein [Psychrobacter okhotskensis]|uniref:GlpM family protein n=1 Tax=Psychrobacter okhotskensis TaxID=212403 RepID=UPI001D0F7E72|nr:GlpM family protein [Psychrobacter okhotskensis]
MVDWVISSPYHSIGDDPVVIWLKMLIGALMVLLIQLFAQTKFFYLAALAPLFPTFTLISHFIVGTERSAADLRVALIFSMLGVIPHLIYTFVVFFSISYVSLYKALLLGVVAWTVAAAILVLTWQYIQA